MQISGQNNNTAPIVPQPQYNSSYNCGAAAPANGSAVQQEQCQAAPQPAYPCGYYYPQGVPIPQQVPMQQASAQQAPVQPGPVQQAPMPQAPTASGVNIQIYSPTVGPGGGCYYPAPYYTTPMAPPQPAPIPQQPAGQAQTPVQQTPQPQATEATAPTQATEASAPVKAEETPEKKKTQKRKIVVLTDDYIKNLENYLNSQDKAIRLSAAKEVFARLEEDDSRKDDKALNALINKMLQDPADDVRFLALTALDSRMVTGDDYTVGVLKKMQTSDKGFGQEAIDASNILLKMSTQTAEKEFEVDETKKKPVKNPLYDMK